MAKLILLLKYIIQVNKSEINHHKMSILSLFVTSRLRTRKTLKFQKYQLFEFKNKKKSIRIHPPLRNSRNLIKRVQYNYIIRYVKWSWEIILAFKWLFSQAYALQFHPNTQKHASYHILDFCEVNPSTLPERLQNRAK